MSVDENKTNNSVPAFHRISRRTFLRLAAHLSLLSAVLPLKRTLAAGEAQATPQASGYGRGAYSQGSYSGPASFGPGAAEHQIYLPIVTKEEN